MQPAGFETATLGMHECIPYELSAVFPFHVLPQKTLPCGMHKCIPYAKLDISLPQKRYRAGNGVTTAANPRVKLAAGPPRKISIYRGSTGRGAQKLWVDCPRFVTHWPRGLPAKFQFI